MLVSAELAFFMLKFAKESANNSVLGHSNVVLPPSSWLFYSMETDEFIQLPIDLSFMNICIKSAAIHLYESRI